MKIKALDHIGINAVDYAKTVAFYRDVLEFKELNSVVHDDLISTYFKIPGGGRMEIFDNLDKTNEYEIKELDNGVRHIAFEVEDVQEHERLLTKKGVELFWKTTELPDYDARVLLFYDPNGVMIEFCEPLS